MSDRGTFRGRGGRGGGFDRGGGRGAHSTQHRGGGASSGGAAAAGAAPQQEKPKKENILDLSKYMDKEVNVKFNGGREGQSGLPSCFRFEGGCSGHVSITDGNSAMSGNPKPIPFLNRTSTSMGILGSYFRNICSSVSSFFPFLSFLTFFFLLIKAFVLLNRDRVA
jgi:hypothetical protein